MTRGELKDIIRECIEEQYIEEADNAEVKKKLSKVDNLKGIGIIGLSSVVALIGAIKSIKAKREEAKREKENKRKKDKQNEEQEARKKYWNSEEGKARYEKLKKEVSILGEKVGVETANRLKAYNKKELYPKYKGQHNYDKCINIAYEPINDYDVMISEYQSGIDSDYIIAWCKQHPDYKNDPELKKQYDELWKNDAYVVLLEKGEEFAKEVFKSIDHSIEIQIHTDTGDGDEGYIYIWYEIK